MAHDYRKGIDDVLALDVQSDVERHLFSLARRAQPENYRDTLQTIARTVPETDLEKKIVEAAQDGLLLEPEDERRAVLSEIRAMVDNTAPTPDESEAMKAARALIAESRLTPESADQKKAREEREVRENEALSKIEHLVGKTPKTPQDQRLVGIASRIARSKARHTAHRERATSSGSHAHARSRG